MTCRTTSAVLQKTGIFKEIIYVTNMPGGSGAVAIANVITKRKGDTNLIVAASNALTFTMAMGRTPHTYKDVIPIAQIGAEIGGFFVKADSKYKTLADMIAALKANPKSVTFAGGSAPGGQDHMKVAMFAKAIGVDPTKVVYVPFQGGGEALTSVLGGHTESAPSTSRKPPASSRRARSAAWASCPKSARPSSRTSPPPTSRASRSANRVARLLHGAGHAGRRGEMVVRRAPEDGGDAGMEGRTRQARLGADHRFGDEFDKFVNKDADQSQALLKELGFLK